MLCIGLFGTCGNSKWREPFIEHYTKLGINYYNPVVPDWKPECADIEAEHLANDAIILFPVTSETYGTGSLAETGFSLLRAIRLDERRHVVLMINPNLDDSLKENPLAYKESKRARALVIAHLKQQNFANAHVVNDLETMLEISIKLYEAEKILLEVKEQVKK
jgi:hypothetical protein